jgi:hypothetical protein
MAAEIEWVTGVLRAGRNLGTFGDPYEFSCTVNVRGQEAELIGGCGEITPSLWREIKDALTAQGIHQVHWKRFNGVPRTVAVDSADNISISIDTDELPVGRCASA